jgi:chromosome segregation and condensation protein ScpB
MNQGTTVQASIESILFIAGEPVAAKKLSTLLGVTEDVIAEELRKLATRYQDNPDSGLQLLLHKDTTHRTSHQGYSPSHPYQDPARSAGYHCLSRACEPS